MTYKFLESIISELEAEYANADRFVRDAFASNDDAAISRWMAAKVAIRRDLLCAYHVEATTHIGCVDDRLSEIRNVLAS